jgi:hypothetical protein
MFAYPKIPVRMRRRSWRGTVINANTRYNRRYLIRNVRKKIVNKVDIPYGSYDIREFIDNRKPDIVPNKG